MNQRFCEAAYELLEKTAGVPGGWGAAAKTWSATAKNWTGRPDVQAAISKAVNQAPKETMEQVLAKVDSVPILKQMRADLPNTLGLKAAPAFTRNGAVAAEVAQAAPVAQEAIKEVAEQAATSTPVAEVAAQLKQETAKLKSPNRSAMIGGLASGGLTVGGIAAYDRLSRKDRD